MPTACPTMTWMEFNQVSNFCEDALTEAASVLVNIDRHSPLYTRARHALALLNKEMLDINSNSQIVKIDFMKLTG